MGFKSERVKTIITTHLGADPDKVTESASLIDDLGADSLDAVELVLALEDEFCIEVPDDEVDNWKLVSDVIATVESRLAVEAAEIAAAAEACKERDED